MGANADMATKQKGDSEDEILVLAFRLFNEEYGLDVGIVQEIVRIMDITRVPNAPSFIRGVINLRGDVIPVVDLRKRFGFADTKVDAKFRIIVLNVKNIRFGIIVDDVSEVVRLKRSDIEPAPRTISDNIDASYLKGVGKIDDRLVILLDLEEALGLLRSKDIEV